ncbi:unnamed protein product [Adineta steineri]|uniref:Uncharacterized protein n=1 Tax=Adineta steineri TaxID=433720 RepID=A0A815S6K9_9BILA|nr:unnamed protein product [Adineta steineri]CAF1639401.1 unnamed protein product [Adineta steineri]
MVRHSGIIILCLLSSTWCVIAYIPNDDISIIHERVMELMVWPVKENISIVVGNAAVFTKTLNSSCYWPDVNYYDKGLDTWFTAEHVYRVTTMLQALTVNGSSLKNDPEIRASAHCALNVWLVKDWQNPNWYFNEIRIPLHLTSQLLMLGDNATSFEIEKIEEISYRAAWWLSRGTDVGANLLWMIQIEIYRSLATNNITGIVQGFTRMWQDITFQSASSIGVQYDWSYHFHGRQLLSGSYGMIWAELIFSFVVCTQGTQFVVSDQQLSLFVDFITKGDAWMIRGCNWDFNVIGRAIARPEREQRVSFYTPSIRKVAELVEDYDTKIQLLSFADRLDDQSNASLLIGNKNFFLSDYQMHHRENWAAGIHMQSSRTQPTECINGENQKAEHTGQGVLNLYVGNTYDYDNVYPLWDWQAINGITVEHDIPLERCNGATFPWILLPFVGGVSDSQYGLAMMDTASHNLTAQRSWHFYDDAIIALATNLTLRTPTTAWTTLASRLLPTGQVTIGFFNSTIITLSDGNYSFPYAQGNASNVQWLHLGGSDIAYLLQSQQQYSSLGIELKNKTANYLDIGAYNATISGRVLTIWINHGVGPYILDYNYIMLPNVSLETVPSVIKQYSEEQVFECTSTNANFHQTMWPSLKRASFVLWNNVTTTFSCKSPLFHVHIKVHDAGAYLFSESETNFTVTASHPTRVGGNVKLTIDRVGSGQGCMPSSDDNAGTTDVSLSLPSSDTYLGASVNVTCNK